MKIEDLKNLLDDFLNKWTLDKVRNITLKEYVGLGDKDTFCQWVETKTRVLGSIKGMTSIKFGIYERYDSNKQPKNFQNDDKYSWLHGYGEDRVIAFENVKRDLISTIEFAINGQFSMIDNLKLPDLFKWKVAFLYSNERLIPIYKHNVLLKIAENLGLETNRNTKISEIHNLMILNKPAHLSVYEFMWELYDKFGREEDKEEAEDSDVIDEPRKRKATKSKNTDSQIKTISRSFIVEQKHNKIQTLLSEKLINEFGAENVLLEENYVDIKVLEPEQITFYEVKSSPYASDCIRESLGQLLSYCYKDNDKRKKRLIVVGQYPPNNNDIKFINYIKSIINIDFEYTNIDIQ